MMAGQYTMTVVGEDKASPVLKKVGETAQSTAKKVDAAGKSGSGFSGLAKAAGGALAVFSASSVVSGISDLTKDFTDLATSVKGIQRVTGGTVEDASRLRTEMQLSGVAADTGTIAMKKLAVALTNAGSTQKSAAAMTKILGTSFQDAHGKVLPMNELMPKIADKFKSMADGPAKVALSIKLFGKNGTAMIPMLNKGSAGLKSMAEESDKLGLTLNSGSMAAMAKSKANAKEMTAAMMGLKTTIGGFLLPIITALTTFIVSKVAPALTKFAGFIRNNSGLVKVLLGVMAGLLAAFKAMKIITDISKAFTAFNAVMAANPVMLIIIGIAALVAGFILLWNKSAAFRNFWKGLWAAIQGAVSGVVGFFKGVATGIVAGFKAVIDWFVNLPASIGNALSAVWKFLSSIGHKFVTFIVNGLKADLQLLAFIFVDMPVKIARWLGGLWSKMVDFGKRMITNVVNGISSMWSRIARFFTGLWGNITTWLSGLWSGVTGVGRRMINSITDGIRTVWDNIGKYFRGLWGNISNWIAGLFAGLGRVGGRIVSSITDAIHSSWDNIGKFFRGLWGNIGQWLGGIFGRIGQWGSDLISNLGSGIYTAWTGVGRWFGNLWSNITGWIGDIVGRAVQWGADFAAGVMRGVGNLASQIAAQLNPFSSASSGFASGGAAALNGLPAMPHAKGGMVSPGWSTFGEEGPEMGYTNAAGRTTIFSNPSTAGGKQLPAANLAARGQTGGGQGGGVTINLHMSGATIGTADQVARQFADLMTGAQRRGIVPKGVFA